MGMIAALVFACFFCIAWLALARMMRPSLVVSERLAYYTQPAGRAAGATRHGGSSTAERLMGRLGFSRSLELMLDQADMPIKPFEFLLITAASGLVVGMIGLLQSARQGSGPGRVFFVMLMIVLGCLLPLAVVHLRRSLRRQAFGRQLPDALQAIGNSLRAGFGFNQGMTVVANDLPAPISVEFARALREMNLGSTVDDVLQTMARRMQSIDFDLAVAGILINRQVGGNLAELLDNIVTTIRERVKLKAFIRVLTAQQRLSAWVVVAVPPVVLVVMFLGMRAYTSYLLVTRVGQVMLVVALCLQLLGGYIIRRIVSIDV
jgi:tight adherence protein B